jgi:hypothetical protein
VRRVPVLLLLAAVGAWSATACSSGSDGKTTARPATTRAETQGTTRTETRPRTGLITESTRKQVYAELARLRDRGASGPAVYRLVAKDAGLSVPSVKLIEREGSLRRWTLPKAPKLPPAAVRAGRPWGARMLRSTTSCSQNAPRTAIAHLRWRPSKAAARQWVAVTNLLRGFELGKYEASAALPPRKHSFEWRRVHGQSIHLWRVITRTRNGRWLGSPTARFTGPTCVAEFEP